MNASKIAVIAFGAMLALGCQRSANTTTDETAQTLQDQRENLKHEFELRLDEIDRRIDGIQDSIEADKKTSQEEAKQTVQSLREEAKEARDALDRLDADSPETWETVRTQTEKALSDVEQKVDEAWQEIVGSAASL
jgi:HAMP domain-containing protein